MSIVHNKCDNYCPLCFSTGKNFYKDKFFQCDACLGIYRLKKFYPSHSEEKQRYETHNNDVNDIRYQEFVSPITSSVLREFTEHSLGLDFGAGTGPVISKVLKDHNYNIKQYDPFFLNNPELLNLKYDYIVCCEVVEHLHSPNNDFQLLKNLLRTDGVLYLMTQIYRNTIDFNNWYYKNDPTHTFFYQEHTFKWIKSHFNFKTLCINNNFIKLSN